MSLIQNQMERLSEYLSCICSVTSAVCNPGHLTSNEAPHAFTAIIRPTLETSDLGLHSFIENTCL